MKWDEYYEKAPDWAVSTSVKKLSTLENVGASDEIADIINVLAFEDKKGATRLLNKAIQCGVKFSGEELVDIWDLCAPESIDKAMRLSADKFTTKDLEDLSLCMDDKQIIEIAKQYKISVPRDIADEYEEVLCTDTTTPISWSRFYEAFQEWSVDYAIRRSQSLRDYGDEDEVVEVVNELYMTDQYGASKFIRRALDFGVKFNADNLIELSCLCDKETVESAVLKSCALLSQDDLEDLYGNIEDDTIKTVAKKLNLKLPEGMRDEYEAEDPTDRQYSIVNAIHSADYALQCLYQAQAAMNTGSNVSFWDMLRPKAFLSIVKYSVLEEAEQELRNAQDALQHLNYDLKNILSKREANLQFTKLASVADMWFDSGFMDCLTYSQIGKVQKRIRKTIGQVEAIRRELVALYNRG